MHSNSNKLIQKNAIDTLKSYRKLTCAPKHRQDNLRWKRQFVGGVHMLKD